MNIFDRLISNESLCFDVGANVGKKRIAPTKNTENVANLSQNVFETEKPKTEVNKSGILFKVQFAATDKEVDSKLKFPNVTDVWFYKVGAVVKYTSGNFNSFDEASKQQAKLKELGYKIEILDKREEVLNQLKNIL
jgi:Zn-finger domain-containing protein